MPIRTLIADDDPGMRLVMRKIIEKQEGFELVGEAQDGGQLIDLMEEAQPQLVILDVEMPKLTGVECARMIQDMNPRIAIIFATAHAEYMSDAFSVYAYDYLLKPFKLERVRQTLERVRQTLTSLRAQGQQKVEAPPMQAKSRLMLRHKEGVSFVDTDSIILVQRENRATVIYTEEGGRYVTSESLGDMEARLPAPMFFRTHKSYIVNVNKMESITPYGRWTYVIQLKGTQLDALITHDKFDELGKLFA